MGLWHNPRLLALVANGLIGLAVVILLGAASGWLISQPYFELRHVQLGAAPGSAMRHVNKDTLIETVRQAPSGNFFTVDMNTIKEVVQQVPWVRKATVRRLWPDTLVVMIEEHRAAALWEDSRLVSVYGELFSANLDEAVEDGPLPQLGGPDGSEHEVMSRFQEIQAVVSPLGVQPVAVNLSARLAWTAKLDDGTELLIGKDRGVPIAERIGRWVESYPLVTERMQRLASVIDLRYPNGYAVRSLEMLADAFSAEALADEPRADDQPTAVMAALTTGSATKSKKARESRPTVKTALATPSSKAASAKAAARAKAKAKAKAKARANAKAKARANAKAKAQAKAKAKAIAAAKAKAKTNAARAAASRKKTATADKRTIAEIRRAATRKAAARDAARSRAAAKARLKARGKQSRVDDWQIQPSQLIQTTRLFAHTGVVSGPDYQFNKYWAGA